MVASNRLFEAAAIFSAIDSSKLVFSKDQGEQMTVSFKYSKDIPLFGPVKLVIDYEGDARAR